MTIKTIAELAHVSVSTVSKVLNNKDDNISEETRKRVLDIAQKYQYIPYKNIIQKLDVASNTIALITPNLLCPFYAQLIRAIEKELRLMGYSMLLLSSDGRLEEEEKQLQIVLSKQVDGIILYPIQTRAGAIAPRTLSLLEDSSIPFVIASKVNEPNIHQTWFDFHQAAYSATKYLIDKMHRKIGFLCNSNCEDNIFLEGYQQALFQNSIPYEERFLVCFSEEEEGLRRLNRLIEIGITALVCTGSNAAQLLYLYAARFKLSIPSQISIILLDDSCHTDGFIPSLSKVRYPYDNFAHSVAQQLKELVYKTSEVEESQPVFTEIEDAGSINVPFGNQGQHSLIIGDLSMDIHLNVDTIPATNGVTVINSKEFSVGGRAANQAICANYLGGNVCVMGQIGDDREGRLIYEALSARNINVSGIKMNKRNSTGCAYIASTENGENAVFVHPGVNDLMDDSQILKYKSLFEGIRFCSLHTAIPKSALSEALRQCRLQRVDVILKPNNLIPPEYEDSFLNDLFLLIPNESELARLLPGIPTLEERIWYYRQKGIRNVLVTLAERGCAFLAEGSDKIRYYRTQSVEAIDTSGASDCFIAALIVCLSSRPDFDYAIQYANYAASLSVTLTGNISASDTKSLLDLKFGIIH